MVQSNFRRRASWLAATTAVLVLLLSGTVLAAPDVVQGDKVTVMGNAFVPAETSVMGNVVTVMGNTTIEGSVQGTVSSVMGNVTINGQVNGDVTAVMGNVTLGPNAKVSGRVNVAMGQLDRAPGAVAPQVQVDNGGWNVNVGGFPGFRPGVFPFAAGGLRLLRPIFQVSAWLMNLALTLLLVLLFPRAMQGVAAAIEKEPGKSLLVGLLTAIAAVPIAFVLLITIIGPVVWILALVAAWYFGSAAAAALVGRRLRVAVRTPEEGQVGSLAWDAVIGVTVLALVGMVPLAGGLVRFLVALAGLGAVVFSNFGSNKPWFRRAT